jgi:hypothetical protein
MTAPGNGILSAALMIVFAVSTGYAAGRIHQWHRASLERDDAYREGYDTATHSLFGVAARLMRPRRAERGAVRGSAAVALATWLAAPEAVQRFIDPGNARTVVDPDGRHKLLERLAARERGEAGQHCATVTPVDVR